MHRKVKLKHLRQIRFNDSTALDVNLLKPYIGEMLKIMKVGDPLPKTKPKKLILTPEFLELFNTEPELEEDFAALSPGKQREYVYYIAEAKRESTRKTRLEKIIPMIKDGKGLNDRYRK
jgi:uncharacterized protein YdeI (YjbR/CyaY-like superfamily)